MAEEPVVEPVLETPAEPIVNEPVEPVSNEPHPLQPGGARFEEVYARMKQAEERAARVEGMLAQAQQQARPQPQQPQYVTPDQLQALVDQGRITPMQAADFLSKQNAQQAAVQTTVQALQAQQLNAKLQSAAQEVNTYIEKIPALRNNASPEFGRVSEAAYRVSEDMGLPVTDLRVQRVALREVYGTLDRLSAAGAARQQTRDASLPHVETTTNGGRPVVPNAKDEAWKKDVPAEYLAYWAKRGYSEQQMKEEAKYVTRAPRKVAKHA